MVNLQLQSHQAQGLVTILRRHLSELGLQCRTVGLLSPLVVLNCQIRYRFGVTVTGADICPPRKPEQLSVAFAVLVGTAPDQRMTIFTTAD